MQVEDRVVSEIGPGLLVLVGVHESDTDADADYMYAWFFFRSFASSLFWLLDSVYLTYAMHHSFVIIFEDFRVDRNFFMFNCDGYTLKVLDWSYDLQKSNFCMKWSMWKLFWSR